MDESIPTCDKRFARLGIPQTEEARRTYRELIVTTPGLAESISGAILYDETIRQQKKDGTPLIKVLIDAGIIPGIKVDIGAKDMAGHPGERITEGLDGLRARLNEYFQMGARFAKWRAVIAGALAFLVVVASRPMRTLARSGALCHEAGLVPVAESLMSIPTTGPVHPANLSTNRGRRWLFLGLLSAVVVTCTTWEQSGRARCRWPA